MALIGPCGAFDNCTIIKPVAIQINIPETIPVTILFFDSNVVLEYSQKKKKVHPKAII